MSSKHNHHTEEDKHAPIGENGEFSEYAIRFHAIETLLVEKGICTREELRTILNELETRAPSDGARIVAHAWADPEFKRRLLTNAKSALYELGYEVPENIENIVVLENTRNIHNLVVCTLCSCYPSVILGRPPDWYKSLEYRSRAVNDPRGVMEEFGLHLEADVEVRVQDSTADLRYLILPRRPSGTDHMNEDELSRLITRDSMIGVTHALSVGQVSSN